MLDLDEIVKLWARDVIPERLRKKSDIVFEIIWDKLRVKTETPTYRQSETHERELRSQSSIRNGTENIQHHEVIVEKKYTATNTVSLSKTFTMGEQTRLTLSLPEEVVDMVFEETADITKIDRETIKKEQAWKIVTKVTVPPHEKATVKQTITVHKYSSTFRYVISVSVDHFSPDTQTRKHDHPTRTRIHPPAELLNPSLCTR